jgi:hypothetical protein
MFVRSGDKRYRNSQPTRLRTQNAKYPAKTQNIIGSLSRERKLNEEKISTFSQSRKRGRGSKIETSGLDPLNRSKYSSIRIYIYT